MNWYKKSQNVSPVMVTSYDSYGDMSVVFDGQRRYVYHNVSYFTYMQLKKLLKAKNYKKAVEILKTL